jgi:hypothetical protein
MDRADAVDQMLLVIAWVHGLEEVFILGKGNVNRLSIIFL